MFYIGLTSDICKLRFCDMQSIFVPTRSLSAPMMKPVRSNGNRKFLITFIVLIISLIIFVYYTQYYSLNYFPKQLLVNDSHFEHLLGPDKHLVYTSKCKITKANPFNADVLEFVYKEPYMNCSNMPILSYIEYSNSVVTLTMNQSLLNDLKINNISCCYSEVTRVVKENQPDNDLSFSDCRPFEKKVAINAFVVKVECSTHDVSYVNVHFSVNVQHVKKEKLKNMRTDKYSVVLVGIDSMSSLNFIRTMPKAHKFLEEHDFFSLKGYTKVGDNTFPNLIAILNGRTETQTHEYCNLPRSKLDDCDIIWDRFSKFGYITGYAEDFIYIATFHYEKLGFNKAPTDFYFHPYIVAAEQLPSKRQSGMTVCSGPEHSGERVLNAAKDFLIQLYSFPKFGFFWMSSFSHDNINLPSSMNDKVEEFLKDIYPYLNNTIFIFFSDHGFRFGDIRHTHTGWFEERLPFFYIYFPASFKSKYPDNFNNFVTNTKRLTNPFDLYMTLQDILHLSNQQYEVQASEGCPGCHSLFVEVDEKRTCQDAAIDQHWCMCTGYVHINVQEKVVIEAAEFIVSELNRFIINSNDGIKCATYYLKDVSFAGISDAQLNDENVVVHYLLVDLVTRPLARFEATVAVAFKSSKKFKLMGDFSRTDRYEDRSKCINGALKKYCVCYEALSHVMDFQPNLK